MAKLEKQFVCANCGYKSQRWQGKCPSCSEWNTFSEQQIVKAGAKQRNTFVGGSAEIVSLKNIGMMKEKRFSTGSLEFDEVLGGGIVAGSLILLGGDPGIGKSTLALQTAVHLEQKGKKVVYVAGEESPYQIKMREQRLGEEHDLHVLPETNLEIILTTLQNIQAEVVVVDSIQTLYSEESGGVTGGVSQIVYATNALMRFAKLTETSVIIIGHVTKEGVLAGPKTLEHMVDAVLYLEGERYGTLRLLRCIKNRFGSVGEVGVFEMKAGGLVAVTNPSGLFLEDASLGKSGSCVTCVVEGNKALLVEVQALVNKSAFGYPKRTASGFDANRLQLILAILEKHLKIPVATHDIYINVTGGFKLEERAADLPVALAIISSLKDLALPKNMVAFGELGLSGEVRGVVQGDKRIKESGKLGFTKVITGDLRSAGKQSASVVYVGHIREILEIIKK